MKKRKCKICGAFLSIYNTEDICYHHPEHIKYNSLGKPNNYSSILVSQCSSLPNYGAFKVSQDYYGCYRD